MHSYYPKIMGWSGASGADNEPCAMCDESSQCTIVLPEECLGYGLVVPFLAYRFALWFRLSHNEDLNSLNTVPVGKKKSSNSVGYMN